MYMYSQIVTDWWCGIYFQCVCFWVNSLPSSEPLPSSSNPHPLPLPLPLAPSLSLPYSGPFHLPSPLLPFLSLPFPSYSNCLFP